jgi:hypothetical protein
LQALDCPGQLEVIGDQTVVGITKTDVEAPAPAEEPVAPG